MENASKALLIAGGVLIAIIIITLLVHTYGNIGDFKRQQLSLEESEKLEEFNKEYTKYLNRYVYGTEVITVINKAYSSKYSVTINIEFLGNQNGDEYAYKYYKYIYENGEKKLKEYTVNTMTLNTNDSIGSILDNNENLNGLKNRYFQCTNIGYDENTGRVNSIKFVEKKVEFENPINN